MCYVDGEFLTPPDIDTAAKMQQFCIREMKKDGINGIFAWLATRAIPRLERWKKTSLNIIAFILILLPQK